MSIFKKSLTSFLLPLTYYLLPITFLTACTSESYETGDGKYSYLRADFGEIHTAKPQQVDYAVNDEGRRISFETAPTVKWAEKGDTLYRALLYFNDLPDKAARSISLQPVYVLAPKAAEDVKDPHHDPVTFESAWLSTCQRTDLTIAVDSVKREAATHYLNMAFLLKTGQPDDEKACQTIGMMSQEADDGSLRLTLLHDQGAIPQYYSTRIYTSIPLTDSQLQRGISLCINTYDGELIRTF